MPPAPPLLFTEEEITRNLQIVLRTFDDLNFRQEQRFHLELGLLKLVHAQRLLPLEELLSSLGTGSMSGPGRANSSAPARSASPAPQRPAPVASHASRPAAAPPSASPFASSSPFGSTPTATLSAPQIADPPRTATVLSVAAPQPVPVQPISAPPVSVQASESLTEGALAKAPAPVAKDAPSVDALRNAIVAALAEAGHSSASQLLQGANWQLDVSSLRIEVPGLGKKMLSLTINAAAEKIVKQELQRLGGPSRFTVAPGEGAASTARADAPVIAGSIQEEALKNPLVQRAKEIFHAEVHSVLDLRTR